MGKLLRLDIQKQPDDTTCGPTCLHAVYAWYGDSIPLEAVIATTPQLTAGGTLAVQLALHALRRGYRAMMYTFDLRMFDPTWFRAGVTPEVLKQRLNAQAKAKADQKLHTATRAFLEYIDRGGKLRWRDLTPDLIEEQLSQGHPILTGLSATFLYGTARERGWDDQHDDILGASAGHFVVLCGLDQVRQRVLVADPLRKMKGSRERRYWVAMHRLIGAILLGVLTYDGNLLVLENPKRTSPLPRTGKES
jgi:hypothetical protein